MNGRKDLPVVSGVLVGINVIIYILCAFWGEQLYVMGNLNAYSVLLQKEYGRIVWAMFLHGGTGHLFNNMLILFFMGAMIEKEVGHVWYLLLYFFSGIVGNMFSLFMKVMSSDMSGSMGASGGVFGLDGVLLAMVLFSGKRMQNVTPVRVMVMIGFSLYSGFTGSNIDNAAHVGGLVTGFLGGCLVCIMQRRRRERQR